MLDEPMSGLDPDTETGLLDTFMDAAQNRTLVMVTHHLAGIDVFATGGVGGVHRGAETTMDISADLEELAQTPVMVICAGAKSILDLGLKIFKR